MKPGAFRSLLLILLVALGSATAISGESRHLDRPFLELSRHRRSLLAATQQISQCDWIQGEGCALHPAYASYALNRSSDDGVAQYVANALACATATDKGLCESASYCYWDPSFSNGQQGCFLQEDTLLSLQLRCVQQQYQPSLAKLQTCMAARQSCQCSPGNSSSFSSTAMTSICTQRQQQVLSSYSSGKDEICSSLLGCWLSSLNSSSPDILQLVEAQLVLVQPKIESLSSSGTSPGRRRVLLQVPPSLSDPVLDDKSGSGGDAYTPESGSYGSSGPPGAASTPSVGMNGVITDDTPSTTSSGSGSSTTPVENGKNVVGAKANSSDDSGTALQLESSTAQNSSDWVLESGLDADKIFGSSPPSSSTTTPAGSSGSGATSTDSSSSGSVQMTGGNAPASFWKCAAKAAVKADQTKKWADIDYNSKSLTLATWAKVIQPTSLIDWGVQVLDCFKTEVPNTSSLDSSTNSTKPNKESLEFAIVALIRSFSAQADTFRTYLQADAVSKASSGLSGLSRLVKEVFPGQLASLKSQYEALPTYSRDVMLQTTAVITDMQWFAGDVLSLASSSTDGDVQQQMFEAYISYSEETIRRCLYWLFYLQFDGPPAYLPGTIPSSAASTAVVSAFENLAAAALPSSTSAADSPGWQQLQIMVATAAGSAAAAAAQSGPALDTAETLANSISGLAGAHVQELWGTRLELARAGASEAARALALRDPNVDSARWEPLRQRQMAMLSALQQRAALGRGADDAFNLRLSNSLRDLVAASGAYLLTGSSTLAAQQQTQQQLSDALGLAARLALLIRQCYGSPAGVSALTAAAAAAAGVPSTAPAACAQLSVETERLASVAGSGIIGSALVADLQRQWRCNSVPPSSCSSKSGCAVALAPGLVPTSTASADSLALVCHASDSSLMISSLDNSSKAGLASNPTCQQFLQLPTCEAISDAANCTSYAVCRWEATSQRNMLHTATNGGNASKGAAAGSRGVCAMDWVSVLSSSGSGAAYKGLQSMIQMCNGINDSGACNSQTMLITLDTPTGGTSSMARFWVPALVAAAVAGVLLFGAAMWWRRRSSAARRAADEARAAAGGGRGGKRGGKDGKGGKGAKALKKKPKRAEPGSYKPDLMRDSFTDYMRAAPQQFENGVAIAKAAMATGSLDAAVAVADVSGALQLPSPRQEGGPMRLFGGGSSSNGISRAASPTGPLSPQGGGSAAAYTVRVTSSPATTEGSTDLIDLSQADAAAHQAGLTGHQDQDGGYPVGPAATALAGAAAGSLWASAAPAAGNGFAAQGPAGGMQQQGRGGLQGPGMSVPVDLLDANASLALTSSIGLVSSLPQHSSLPMGLMAEPQQAQHGMGPGATARAGFGASNSLMRISSSSLGLGRGSPIEGAASGSLLLPVASRGGVASEDGSTTPTSSCCHDSVCTFRQGPGSVASGSGTSGGSGSTRLASAGSIWRSQQGSRPVGAAGRAAGVQGVGNTAAGGVAGAGGSVLPGALSGALSSHLSRSSWSSAMSTDLLMPTQTSSAIMDP